MIAIPLPNGLFAFARILNDAGLAIYDHLASDAPTIESFVDLPIRFYTGFFDKAMRDVTWTVIGHVAARNKDDNWQPPCFIRNEFRDGSFEIYHRGKIGAAKAADIKGLEEQVMHYPDSLIDEINRRFAVRGKSLRNKKIK